MATIEGMEFLSPHTKHPGLFVQLETGNGKLWPECRKAEAFASMLGVKRFNFANRS